MTVRPFGTLADGTEISAVTIADGELSATILTFGAVVQDIRLGGVAHPLVLGFPTIEAYLRNPNYFGAVVGRFANRIGKARFPLAGKIIELVPNEGQNQLHGGAGGFGTRVWTLIGSDARTVTLGLVSADGENGYPARLVAELTYSIEAPSTLRMEVQATADGLTIVNFAQHSYFNLDGGGTIVDHQLMIPADAYLPVDDERIPTGEIRPVAGTEFDFRDARPVGQGRAGIVDAYDHNFCVAHEKSGVPRRMALLSSQKSGVSLEVLSTEPGVQFYGGQRVNTRDAGLTGAVYGANAGLCLEAQLFPDAPNHANFPSGELKPGDTYRQETLFTFARI